MFATNFISPVLITNYLIANQDPLIISEAKFHQVLHNMQVRSHQCQLFDHLLILQ